MYQPECGCPPEVTRQGGTRASSCSRCAVTVTLSRRLLHQPSMSRTLFRTRIKFCGMTRAGDVRLAGALGADAVGFLFSAGSPPRTQPRHARLTRPARELMEAAGPVVRDNPAGGGPQ